MKASISGYDPRALNDTHKTGGPPELAPEVARRSNEDALAMFALAEELAWLVRVLPPMSEGNFDPYNAADSPARLLVKHALSMLGLGPDTDTTQMFTDLPAVAAAYSDDGERSIIRAAALASRQP